MHTETPETNNPAPRKPLDQLTAAEYLALSKEDKAFYRRVGSGQSKKVSPLSSFVASVATFRTAKERKEAILAHVATEENPALVRVFREPTVKSVKDAFALGARRADEVADIDTSVSFGGKGGKVIVSDNAYTVAVARRLVEALEDAKEQGLPRNHPERRAIVARLRSIGQA